MVIKGCMNNTKHECILRRGPLNPKAKHIDSQNHPAKYERVASIDVGN